MDYCVVNICPVCSKEIKEDDAVKVCPACGIPHHENCWEENKGCTTFGCSEWHYEEQHTNPTDVCANCGAPLGDGQEFCPKCGTPKGGEKKNICGKCGTQLQDGQEFCPKCGQKAGTVFDYNANFAINQFNNGVQKNKNKKVLILYFIGIAAIIAIVLFFVVRGKPVSEVSLSKNEILINVGDSLSLGCTVSPDDATDKKVHWNSSNNSIAKVSNGIVTGVGKGSCTITVKSNSGKTDTCKVIVEDVVNFAVKYANLNVNAWCEIASDGTWMKLDTNPYNINNSYTAEAYNAIESVIADLGFSSSVIEEMIVTRALDGRQTVSTDKYEVSWSYHPDNGLEVIFKVK